LSLKTPTFDYRRLTIVILFLRYSLSESAAVSESEPSPRNDGSKPARVKLTIELPKVSPQGVGWREALDGIRGLVACTFHGKVTKEHVEAT